MRYKYEHRTYDIVLEVPGHFCGQCGGKVIGRISRYTPDFYFPDTKWVVEAKGKFTAKDRKRCLAFYRQHSQGKYALLFMRNNRLTKGSKTTYTAWAEKHGIPCAVGWFKREWYDAGHA